MESRRPEAGLNSHPIRVLVAKPGLDGHDRGAQVVARALSDAGMEVIYSGIRQTPEMIVAVALQEDVDCIGLSVLSGAHREYGREVLELLREKGADDIPVILGGIIPDEHLSGLREMGISAVFGPGSSTRSITATINELTRDRRSPGRAKASHHDSV